VPSNLKRGIPPVLELGVILASRLIVAGEVLVYQIMSGRKSK
jgi:hypothetical protein